MVCLLLSSCVLFASVQPVWGASAQECKQTKHSMPGMEKSTGSHQKNCGMPQMQHTKPGTSPLIATILQHTGSGTSLEPASTPVPMLMTTARKWQVMFHGEAFLSDVQQSGPRGADKL